MVSLFKEKFSKETEQHREAGAHYYGGFTEPEQESNRWEDDAPYKLEPSATEIEDFLTRLRQEGL